MMRGDCDQISMKRYTCSHKETLKQTMLKQEVLFRDQVRELHRLYRVQKSLMMEFGWKDTEPYDLGKASTWQSLGHFTKRIRFEPLETVETFLRIPMVCSSTSRDGDLLQGHKNVFSGVQQRNLDSQLPGSDYINHAGRDFEKVRHSWNFLEKSMPLKPSFCSDHTSSLVEVNLSLSIGCDGKEKSVGQGTWTGNINCYSSQHIIDLEKPLETVQDKDATPVSPLSCPQMAAYGEEHNNMRVSDQSCGNLRSCQPEDQSRQIGMDYSLEHCSLFFGRHNFNQGFNKNNSEFSSNLLKRKSPSSYEAVDLDLNREQLDESSFHSNHQVRLDPCKGISDSASVGPTGRFDTCSGRYLNSKYFNETSAFFLEIMSPSLMDSKSSIVNVGSRSERIESICGTKACPIDFESLSGPPSDLTEDPHNLNRDSVNKNKEFLFKLNNSKNTDGAVPKISIENKKENTPLLQFRSQDNVGVVHSGHSLVSCQLECIDDDNSSGIKHPNTDMEESNTTPPNIVQNCGSSHVANTSRKQDVLSSVNSQMKHQSCGKKKEAAEVDDVLVQKAALSLIFLSLGIPFGSQNCNTNTGSNGKENGEGQKPHYSSDSYEALVLKQPESSVDDYCVTSKVNEVDEIDKKECRIKLRRGRRLKDFQKEILPSLASLSRQEICEDINIMDGVIRSREYKKFKSKMVSGENWFTPVRSRRSRLTCIGRRYY